MNRLERVFGTAHPAALVTGAGAPRVGRCVARTLAARGYRVALHARRSIDQARTEAAASRAEGADAIAVEAELTDERQVAAMADQVRAAYGRIDVLVNCAAMWRPRPLEDVDAAEVRRNLEANTLSVFLCCQKAGLIMAGQPRGGAIVNIGDWAIVRPYRNYAAYFPSKGAIPTLTRTFAVELAARNPAVRVNAVLPGPVMLPEDLPEAERRQAIAGTLVRREGRPEHVADAVVLLAENDFITGVCLPVDGGRSVAGG